MSEKAKEGVDKAKEGAEAAKEKAQGGKRKPRKEKSKHRKDKSKQHKGVVGYCRTVVGRAFEAYWSAKTSCLDDPGLFAPLHTEVEALYSRPAEKMSSRKHSRHKKSRGLTTPALSVFVSLLLRPARLHPAGLLHTRHASPRRDDRCDFLGVEVDRVFPPVGRREQQVR